MVTVRVPTTVLWGEADVALPPALLDGLANFVPDLDVQRIPGGTHWVVHEQPALVADTIARLVARGDHERVGAIAGDDDRIRAQGHRVGPVNAVAGGVDARRGIADAGGDGDLAAPRGREVADHLVADDQVEARVGDLRGEHVAVDPRRIRAGPLALRLRERR